MGKYTDMVEIKSQIEKLMAEMIAMAMQNAAPAETIRRQREAVAGVRQQAHDLPKGVSIDFRTKRYGAKIKSKGKLVWLGTFEKKEDALEAWNAAHLRRSAGLEV